MRKIANWNKIPNKIIEGEEVLIPTFELVSWLTIRLSDIKQRRFNIIDRKNIFNEKEYEKSTEEYIRDIEDLRGVC